MTRQEELSTPAGKSGSSPKARTRKMDTTDELRVSPTRGESMGVWGLSLKGTRQEMTRQNELFLHPLGSRDFSLKGTRQGQMTRTDELSTPAWESGTQPQRHEGQRQMDRTESSSNPLGSGISSKQRQDRCQEKMTLSTTRWEVW
eukprot:gene18051-24472_t